MKNLLVTLLLLGWMAGSALAQNTFKKDDKIVNAGIGFGSALYAGSHYTNKIPPISGSFEMGIMDNLFDDKSSLGVGGYLGYTGAKWAEVGYSMKFSSIILGARGAVHYQLVEKLDTYSGIMIGYNLVNSKVTGNNWIGGSVASSGITASWFVGGRYYFTDQIAGLVELGYGVAFLNLGVAIKL